MGRLDWRILNGHALTDFGRGVAVGAAAMLLVALAAFALMPRRAPEAGGADITGSWVYSDIDVEYEGDKPAGAEIGLTMAKPMISAAAEDGGYVITFNDNHTVDAYVGAFGSARWEDDGGDVRIDMPDACLSQVEGAVSAAGLGDADLDGARLSYDAGADRMELSLPVGNGESRADVTVTLRRAAAGQPDARRSAEEHGADTGE